MLAPETVRLLEAGSALVAATVTRDGEPFAARGWGLTVVSPEAGEVRLLVAADDTAALEHLRAGAPIAITGGDVRTLRSVQLKGAIAAVEAALPPDERKATQYREDFFRDVSESDGIPYDLLERLRPSGFVAVVAIVDDAYDQTPGPGAGAAMATP